MPLSEEIFAAILGGLVPSLVWLFFWLREDRCAPEPKLRIVLTFVAGAVAVGLVLPFEKAVIPYFSGIALLVLWAAFEELFKLGAAAIFGFKSSAYDEPIDAVIYMVTAALGFSAAENALFLWAPLHNAEFMQSILTGDMRFIGATLLHTLSSATIGLALAFTYNAPPARRLWALLGGVILAITLHTLFNFFILQAGGATGFGIFLTIWAGIVAILFLLERVKDPARDYC